MSEPRIAIKIVHNRFVTVYPMGDQRPEEVTFPQHLLSSRNAQIARLRRSPYEPGGIGGYIQTREDQS